LGLGISESINSDLKTLGQSACANATGVALAAITPSCGIPLNGKRTNAAAGQKCSDALETGFRTLATACGGDPDADPDVTKGLKDSTACESAKASALGSIAAACPAQRTNTGRSSSILNAAASTGKDVDALANAGQVVANNIAQAKSLTSASLDDCSEALVLAADLPSAACGLSPGNPALAALAKKACDQASAAVLGVVAVPCGLGGAQKSDPADFAAGVTSGQGKPCTDVSTSAVDAFNSACSVNGTLVASGACSRAQVKVLGSLAASCPFPQQ
jgi:hypothetical protein